MQFATMPPRAITYSTHPMQFLRTFWITALLVLLGFAAFAQPDPNQGPGGPILVVSNPSNLFGRYTAEILRAEGINAFQVLELPAVDATVLQNYDVVILGETALSPAQVTLFTNWVNNGGVFIAFRPDKNLASLLGVTDAGTTLSDAYLQVQTATAPGLGITAAAMQFHGTGDLYNLSGATAVATFFSTAATPTPHPAVTWRAVGANGGKAIGFMYDLFRPIVYTRQGNPAWVNDDRDGEGGVRPNDLFHGPKTGDVQPNWVDFNKIQIPQADEQQRLLANIILKGNEHQQPLPRFWYLPRDLKAAIILTGDDHGGNNGTKGRFDYLLSISPSNTPAAVEDWIALRTTSSIYATNELTPAEAAAYEAMGFEVTLHFPTNCVSYDPLLLGADYALRIAEFTTAYPTIQSPATVRTHCTLWQDWAGRPKAELQNGVRLNTDYYYFPPNWVQDRPGLFTGSALAMRFADTDGTIINNYQLSTVLSDESGQTVSTHVTTLLDNALGTNGYYGVFCANIHTDFDILADLYPVVSAAQSRNVPLITARQLLTWLDGRNASSFGNMVWNNNTLDFTITAAAGTKSMRAMLPRFTGTGTTLSLQSVSRNGVPLTVRYEVIKGISYAFFDATTGNYTAVYASSTCSTPSASLVASSSAACSAAPINLQLTNASGNAPYTVVVNGITYENVTNNSIFASIVPGEVSLWGNGTPVLAVTNAQDNGGGIGATLGMKFRSTVAGYVTGVKFYKGSSNTGPHVGRLYTASGTELAVVTFTGTDNASVGWKTARFSNPVLINPNTTYVIAYYSPLGYFAYSDFYFQTSGFTNGPLTALQNGVDGLNGVGNYGPTFPVFSFQSRNYWVDVLFAPLAVDNPSLYNFTITSMEENNGCVATGTVATASLNCGPLPVELLSFRAGAVGKDALLQWTTGSESNNKGFDVQRSRDGSRWETIGFVEGAGQSAALRRYTYKDPSLAAGRYYYRLVQVDFDGRSKTSSVEAVTITGKLSFELRQNYPNPFRGATSVELILPAQKKVHLGLYDVNGRLVKTLLNETRAAGYHLVQFDAGSLSSGMYYLRLETDDYRAVRKVTIE